MIKNFSLELNQEEVKQLIKEACEREIGRKVLSVDFTISAGYDDRFEHSPAALSKVVVKLGEEIKSVRHTAERPDDAWGRGPG